MESRSSGWDQIIPLFPALLEEPRLWLCNIDRFNGYSIRPPPGFNVYDGVHRRQLFCFWSFFRLSRWFRSRNVDVWTFPKFKTILYVLFSYATQLQSKCVIVKTNSQSHLQTLVLDIFQLCLDWKRHRFFKPSGFLDLLMTEPLCWVGSSIQTISPCILLFLVCWTIDAWLIASHPTTRLNYPYSILSMLHQEATASMLSIKTGVARATGSSLLWIW